MTSVITEALEPGDVRGALIALGLNSPTRRFIAAAAAAGIVLYAIKQPSASFTDEGRVRKWSVVSSELDATHVHFLVFPTVAGLVAATFL